MDNDEFLIHTTIRIEAFLPNSTISTGTGFFFTFFEDEEQKIPAIITNKHVIEGAYKIVLRFSLKENDKFIEGQIHTFEIVDLENFVIRHPDNNIDLCMIAIAPLINSFHQQNKKLFFTTLTKKEIMSEEYLQKNISNIEDITVVGYPDGIWDSANNLPIVRKGITATSLKYDFERTPKFLIDSAIYNGSSGSPVFIFNQGSYAIKNNLYAGGRVILVGIVYAVTQHTVSGDIKIVLAPATNTKPISITNIPNNLGVVIKANKILDFEQILSEKLNQAKNS